MGWAEFYFNLAIEEIIAQPMLKRGRIKWGFNSTFPPIKSAQVFTVFSSKKLISQLPILSKLNFIYDNFSGNFLDETHIDSYFYHSILDVSTVEAQTARSSKGSKKIPSFPGFSSLIPRNSIRDSLFRKKN